MKKVLRSRPVRWMFLAASAHHVWPTGWGVGPEAKAGHPVIRVKHNGRSS
jgi:hypothetical protein